MPLSLYQLMVNVNTNHDVNCTKVEMDGGVAPTLRAQLTSVS